MKILKARPAEEVEKLIKERDDAIRERDKYKAMLPEFWTVASFHKYPELREQMLDFFDKATNINMRDAGKFIDQLTEWLDDVEKGIERRNS